MDEKHQLVGFTFYCEALAASPSQLPPSEGGHRSAERRVALRPSGRTADGESRNVRTANGAPLSG